MRFRKVSGYGMGLGFIDLCTFRLRRGSSLITATGAVLRAAAGIDEVELLRGGEHDAAGVVREVDDGEIALSIIMVHPSSYDKSISSCVIAGSLRDSTRFMSHKQARETVMRRCPQERSGWWITTGSAFSILKLHGYRRKFSAKLEVWSDLNAVIAACNRGSIISTIVIVSVMSALFSICSLLH